ncbi:hypothetical protein J132_06011, partial [Termitomyces sp. J132]
IGTLNLRGFRTTGSLKSESKWNHINQLIRDKKIGILMVQETHLMDVRKEDAEKLFGKRMKILHSCDPENPMSKGGVAVVLNCNLINTQGAELTEIILGRAILVSTNWHKEEVINILVVYAPNMTEDDGRKNGSFWRELKQYFIDNPNIRVDVLAGDMNMVNLIYWYQTKSKSKLRRLVAKLESTTGCPPSVYVQSVFIRFEVYTDHHLTTVQIAHADAPIVGRGRWTLKKHIMNDKTFRKFVIRSGAEAVKEIERMRELHSQDCNPQKIYSKWKKEIIEMAKSRDKAITPKYMKVKRTLEEERETILSNTNLDADKVRNNLRELTSKMMDLESKQHDTTRERIRIKNRLKGETLCKYWTKSNKKCSPRDMIYALKIDNAAQTEHAYEKDSKKMAVLAMKYHNNLQYQFREVSTEIREEKISKVLANIDAHTTEFQSSKLGKTIEEDEL